MAVSRVVIKARTLFGDGHMFGDVGQYERVDGVLEFAVDPTNEANSLITDLAIAPRDTDGMVTFKSDFTFITPKDQSLGSDQLLVDVVNRGRRQVMGTFNLATPSRVGSAEVPLGDGFLCRYGYSVLSIGWQWDVYRSAAMIGLEPPFAQIDRDADSGQVLVEIRPDFVQKTRLLANRVHQPYPVADIDDPRAYLLVKDWEDGPYETVPRDRWRFARETEKGVEPSDDHIYVEDGLQPGKIYHVVYTSGHTPVVGVGLLAVRDVASFLRNGPSELAVKGFGRTYAYGVSQTGRLLRHLVYLGLNQDEQGRQVYDGLLIHVAGGRRGEFNQRFGQPSVQSTPGFGHVFPFADQEMVDPYSEERDGLLSRVRSSGTAPRIFYTNTAAEYWRGDGSLKHIDPTGRYDLEEAPESRTYLFASTQHTHADSLPAPGDTAVDGTERRFPANALDYRPLLRAALINMSSWVSEGTEPPVSSHPRLADRTAVTRTDALNSLDVIEQDTKPDPDRLWVLRETDLGPQSDKGVARYPVVEGRTYPAYVSALDSDGNEVAGIRLPDISVPTGTHSGWNPRRPDAGAPEQIIPMVGFSLFFPPETVQSRYPDRADYEKRVREATDGLVRDRHLLREDVDVVIDGAVSRYDDARSGNVSIE